MVKTMKRREFLSQGAALGLGLSLSTWGFAQAPRNAAGKGPRLLFVLLRGGMDTDSLLFQHANPFYYEQRPNIAVARQGFADDDQRINTLWAMHPALEPLFPWVQKKELAFVPFTGTQDNSRSHFKAQEILERGMVQGQARAQNGLLNRILVELSKEHTNLGGVNFVKGVPLICAGSAEFPYVDLKQRSDAKGERLDQNMKALREMYLDPNTNERLKAVSAKQTGARDTLRMQMDYDMEHGAMASATPGVQAQFEQVAHLMKAGGPFSVGFVEVNGWDTHQGQGNEVGLLSGKLGQLAQALAAFAQAMGPAWAETHLVAMSEFGRTFAENGTKGTDHGHGSTMMLMSGKPYTDSVLGEQRQLRPEHLHEQRDAPILNPYKQVLLDQVLRRMGLSAAAAKRALLLT